MFREVKNFTNTGTPFEYYLMKKNEAVEVGEALVLADGVLTKCGATVTPEFISAAKREGSYNKEIPVVRISEASEFETTLNGEWNDKLVGQSVTLDTDGLGITATIEKGVFKVSRKVEDKIWGFFRR